MRGDTAFQGSDMNNQKSRRSLARRLALPALLATGFANAAPQVQMFAPQGEAKDVRQVTVRFSEPVVAFGSIGSSDPFDVQCEGNPERSKGRGRWADTRNWIFDFDSNLPAGQRCRFTLKSD